MNYFAHALPHLDRPYFLAGIALPDWLRVIDRKLRVRTPHALPYVQHEDAELADFAAGVVRHHADDGWFHQQPAFLELSSRFSIELREVLGDEPGMRAGFLGHILVELILDAELAGRAPGELDRYYAALRQIEPARVQAFVNRLAPRPTELLAPLIPRFIAERFLYDYAEDAKLLRRLNQVMSRVGLARLPDSLVVWLPQARHRVGAVVDQLYPSPSP